MFCRGWVTLQLCASSCLCVEILPLGILSGLVSGGLGQGGDNYCCRHMCLSRVSLSLFLANFVHGCIASQFSSHPVTCPRHVQQASRLVFNCCCEPTATIARMKMLFLPTPHPPTPLSKLAGSGSKADSCARTSGRQSTARRTSGIPLARTRTACTCTS